MGKSRRFIQTALKIGDKRIKKVRELASAKCYLAPDASLPPFPEPLFEPKERLAVAPSNPETRLLPHKDEMAERLAAGWHNITVFEELPFKVARSSLYRFLDRHGLGESDPAERGGSRNRPA